MKDFSILTEELQSDLNVACVVIGLTFGEINEKFDPSWPSRNADGSLMFDMQTPCATITCILDEHWLCNSSYVFFDDEQDLSLCVNYCETVIKNTHKGGTSCSIAMYEGAEFGLMITKEC